jgi:acetate---CoA ligase (ADP-forming) subunit alpha
MSSPKITDELRPLFEPRSVAVIGASNDITKWGFSTFASIRSRYRGELYAVNHRDASVQGRPTYPSVTAIPGPVDLAVFVVPAEHVAAAMRDCAAKGVKAGVIITAGFAETGPAGRARQDEFMAIARAAQIRLVGPNCMGLWSAAADLPAFMFPLPIMPGPLALVSQGGNVGGALVTDAVTRGVGFRYYISCGGMADLPMEDYIQYLAADDTVGVIMAYIEGLGDGARFIDTVARITPRKPVIAVKPGKTPAAARAISSHSGSLSGADAVYEAAFKKAGVIRVDTTQELLDVAIALLHQPLPRGPNVVVTTPGGSYGVMCADACASRGLNLIDLPEPVLEAFNAMFPPRWSHGNPVDPAGDRNFFPYLKAPEIILARPEVDALIFMGFGSFSGISAMISNAGEEIGKKFDAARAAMPGLPDLARGFLANLDHPEPGQLRNIIRIGIAGMFGTVMAGRPDEQEQFLDTIVAALSGEPQLEQSFIGGLRQLFAALADGSLDGARLADIMMMMEPLLDALISHWLRAYGKPIITTTFTEETAHIGPAGHFPYPNAERAAAVLARLLERRRFLDAVPGACAG